MSKYHTNIYFTWHYIQIMVDQYIPIIGLHKQSLYSLVGKSWIDDNVSRYLF